MRATITKKRRDAFLADIVNVYKRHGLALGHEDGHGAFQVEAFAESNVVWLNQAMTVEVIGATEYRDGKKYIGAAEWEQLEGYED